MFSSSKKPYTAVTVYIERLTGPEYDENDFSGIVDLIEVIRIQDTGPTEAARALRKKLKYGTTDRQLRALTILDGLIQNAGPRFQKTFADEPLLERLRQLPRDDMIDTEVREKCNLLFRQWAATYQNQAGMGGIANLYKELPKRSKPTAAQSRVVQETQRQADEDVRRNPFGEDDEPEPAPPPQQQPQASFPPPQQQQQTPPPHNRKQSGSGSRFLSHASGPGIISSSYKNSSKKSKSKNSRKPFDLQKEGPQIMQSIAQSNVASTNLLNSLKFINREQGELPSQNAEVMNRFESAKQLRRQILRYIQLVESEQWIGSLLQANDELVKSLMAWEVMEKGIEQDSDSEVEDAISAIRNSQPPGSPGGRISMSGASGIHSGGPAGGRTSLGGADNKGKSISDQLQGLQIGSQREEAPPPKPPRPSAQQQQRAEESESEEDDANDDDDDPFGDHAAIRA